VYSCFHSFVIGCAISVAALASAAAAQPCTPAWGTENELPGLTNPLDEDRDVGRAWSVFDEGAGPVLFSGGLFTHAGDLVINGLARWDGVAWSAVGGGVTGQDGVYALVTFDDGTGDALYVGGSFTHAGEVAAANVAKWDGQQWSPLGWGFRGGVPHTIVYALTVFDDGSGPAVFAGGRFIESITIRIRGVGKFNGTLWESTGSLMNEKVNALGVFDDGAGEALYAGGLFTSVGGITTNGIAMYDGSTWHAVGGGVGGNLPYVRALKAFDDGSGPALFVGGNFTSAGGVAASKVAKWDGQDWSSLGVGLSGWVTSFQVFDDGSGPAIYAGGKFTHSGSTEVNYLAKWNPGSQTWTSVGGGVNRNIYGMGVYDDGHGPDLYLNGLFTSAGGVPANSVARWHGCLTLPGNLDADGDLDSADVDRFVACLTGPGLVGDDNCDRGDTDGDGDIDLRDYAALQSGPFVP